MLDQLRTLDPACSPPNMRRISMSTEENKAVVRRFLGTFFRRDVAALREVAAPDLAKVAIEQWMPMVAACWADPQWDITEMVAEGDKVWARVTHSGRHIGEWQGLPATGKTSTGMSVGFARVSGGKVVEFGGLWDDLARLQQLGGVVVSGGQ
jgi:C-1 hydroxylase